MRDAGAGPSSRCDTCDGRPADGQARVRAGSALCTEGAPAGHVFPVISGYARETRGDEGRRVGLRLIGPGTIVGIEAIWHGRYGSTVQALTTMTVCSVDVHTVTSALDDDPDRRGAIERLLAAHIEQLREAVVRREAMTAEERVLSVFEGLLAEHPTSAWMRLPFSRKELAEHLGLAEETVSRMIHRLARRGALEVDGRLIRIPASRPPA